MNTDVTTDPVEVLKSVAADQDAAVARCEAAGRDSLAREYRLRAEAVRSALATLQSSHIAKADPQGFLAAQVIDQQDTADRCDQVGRASLAKEYRIAGDALRAALTALVRPGTPLSGHPRDRAELLVRLRVDALLDAARLTSQTTKDTTR